MSRGNKDNKHVRLLDSIVDIKHLCPKQTVESLGISLLENLIRRRFQLTVDLSVRDLLLLGGTI